MYLLKFSSKFYSRLKRALREILQNFEECILGPKRLWFKTFKKLSLSGIESLINLLHLRVKGSFLVLKSKENQELLPK